MAIFLKGLTHGFGPKMAIYPSFFFLRIIQRKMSFTILQNKKNTFLDYKNKKFKKSKKAIFPKGFGLKMAIFPTFFSQTIQARKMSFTIFQNKKNAFLGYKNKKFKKSKNGHFSKGVNPWSWSKNGYFSNFFFSDNIVKENVFSDNLQRKHAFLGYINKKFKRSKN